MGGIECVLSLFFLIIIIVVVILLAETAAWEV